MRILKFPHSEFHQAAYTGPQALLTAGRQGTPYKYDAMRLWDLAGDASQDLPGKTQRELCRLLFRPGGTAYLRASGAWPESEPLPLARHAAEVERALAVSHTGTAPLAFAPDGAVLYSRVATESGNYHMQFLLRVPGVAVHDLYRAQTMFRTAGGFSSDGRLVALTADERTVAVYDVATRGAVRELTHGGKVSALAFVSDRRLAVAASRSVHLWDVTTGRAVEKLRSFRRFAESLAVSHDRTRFAAGSLDGLVRVWESATGREEKEYFWDIGSIQHLAFAPDGTTAAAVGPGAVAVWDVE